MESGQGLNNRLRGSYTCSGADGVLPGPSTCPARGQSLSPGLQAQPQTKMFSRDKFFCNVPLSSWHCRCSLPRSSHFCLSPTTNSYNIYPKNLRHVILGFAFCHTVLLNTKHHVQNSVQIQSQVYLWVAMKFRCHCVLPSH